MIEHTEHSLEQPDAVPARVDLEDFIEAAMRGATRAWTAPDDVDGYGLRAVSPPPYFIGFTVYCRPPFAPLGGDVIKAGGEVKQIRQGL